MTFYNRYGDPICYTEDGENIFSFRGSPLGYIYEREKIYSYDGDFLGWFNDGWIIDRDGEAVFFTENARGGLVTPTKHIAPTKSVRRITPIKCTRHIPPVRPVFKLSWSRYTDTDFFN